ncbi:MAG TPA: alcohol dehydrogenase catalytic domain-containing protein [Thermodesulfobacteriota bacterium]|nr:alcohol dehydrogenase catalytic domain-containing protein [Thermodesulfobacteriota bacterium]
MLAVVKNFSQKGVTLKEVPRPEFSSYEVMIKVKAIGICGSDIRMFNEVIPGRKGIIIGHEIAGEIAELGEKVHGYERGDRVATAICIGCAICRYCRKGYFNLCDKLEEIGITMDGGMAEYVSVPARNIHRIPESVSFEEATLTDPLSCTIRGLEMVSIQKDSWVTILGPGTIGLLAVQIAKRVLRAKVIVTGTRDDRLALAKDFGADYTVNVEKSDPVKFIKDVTDGGADFAFEATGQGKALENAFFSTKRNGAIVALTVHKQIQINMEPVIRNELKVFGSICYNYKEFDQAMDLIQKKRVDLQEFTGTVFALRDIDQAFASAMSRQGLKVIVRP